MTLPDSKESKRDLLVHVDPPEHRLPLPLVESVRRPAIALADLPFDHCAAIRASRDRWIYVRLLTDSQHLSSFFVGQWGSVACTKPDATIFALARRPEHYGTDPGFSDQRTWLRHEREVWQFGTEYYGTIKVSIRGICSELARDGELFLHGCALQVGAAGVALSGVSGSGKTTLTAALRALGNPRALVVNDDWGALSLSERSMLYTGERSLHMKYRSVVALRPDLEADPRRFASENYDGDSTNPHARLLAAREDVFGPDGIADEVPLSAYVVVFRNPEEPSLIRPLRAEDLSRIEAGEYSAFYQRHERFLDGSLFLPSPSDVARHRDKLKYLLSSIPAWMVNNAGSPSETARQIVNVIGAVS
jgi:hypothetical protein